MSYARVLGNAPSSRDHYLSTNHLTRKELPWKLWFIRHRTRKQLKALLRNDPQRVIQDLGLHSIEVQRECKKWFWQP